MIVPPKMWNYIYLYIFHLDLCQLHEHVIAMHNIAQLSKLQTVQLAQMFSSIFITHSRFRPMQISQHQIVMMHCTRLTRHNPPWTHGFVLLTQWIQCPWLAMYNIVYSDVSLWPISSSGHKSSDSTNATMQRIIYLSYLCWSWVF